MIVKIFIINMNTQQNSIIFDVIIDYSDYYDFTLELPEIIYDVITVNRVNYFDYEIVYSKAEIDVVLEKSECFDFEIDDSKYNYFSEEDLLYLGSEIMTEDDDFIMTEDDVYLIY